MTLSCPAAALPMQAKAAQNLNGPASSASPGEFLEEGLWAGLTAQESFHDAQWPYSAHAIEQRLAENTSVDPALGAARFATGCRRLR